jgi:hypothetical protein
LIARRLAAWPTSNCAILGGGKELLLLAADRVACARKALTN